MKEQGDRKKQDVEFWGLFRRLDQQDRQVVRASILWRLYRRAWQWVEPLVLGGQRNEDKSKKD